MISFVFDLLSMIYLSSNIVVRVPFSPGRDRACRHCWISSFAPPWENGTYFLIFFHQSFNNKPLDNTWNNFQKISLTSNTWKTFRKSDFLRCCSKFRCGGVLMVYFLTTQQLIKQKQKQTHNFQKLYRRTNYDLHFSDTLNIFNGRQTLFSIRKT